jgi:hypothetical protein
MKAVIDIDLSDRSMFDDRPSGEGEKTPEILRVPSFHTASAICGTSPVSALGCRRDVSIVNASFAASGSMDPMPHADFTVR